MRSGLVTGFPECLELAKQTKQTLWPESVSELYRLSEWRKVSDNFCANLYTLQLTAEHTNSSHFIFNSHCQVTAPNNINSSVSVFDGSFSHLLMTPTSVP
jgi:hypothetical protein